MISRFKTSAFFMVALLVLFSSGCSEKSATPTTPTAPVTLPQTSLSEIRDFGTLIFSGDEPVIEDLDDGKTARLTATPLPDGTVQIKSIIEERDASGKRSVLGTPQAIAAPGQSVELTIGKIGLKLTPELRNK